MTYSLFQRAIVRLTDYKPRDATSPVPQNEKEKKQALNNLTLRDSACRLQGGPA
jgi:hypothetical protein